MLEKLYDSPVTAAVMNFILIWLLYLSVEGGFSLIDQQSFAKTAFQPDGIMIIGLCSVFYAAIGYFRTKKEGNID